jgi:type II secretory pathway pseudopilin PulG
MRNWQLGLSLVEALAALVILSLGASIALTWFVQSADRLAKLRSEEAALLAQMQAVDFLQTVDPERQPQGRLSLSEYELRWSSQRVAEKQRSMTALGGDGRFEVSIFQLDAVLWRRGEAEPPSPLAPLSTRAQRGVLPASPDPRIFSLQVATYVDTGDAGLGKVFGTGAR